MGDEVNLSEHSVFRIISHQDGICLPQWCFLYNKYALLL